MFDDCYTPHLTILIFLSVFHVLMKSRAEMESHLTLVPTFRDDQIRLDIGYNSAL